ncbi:hypothetical protein LWI29_018334 [Acer saccharum]|uniref:Basic leucine-zipper C-terminal domain-containing protein n=1 Tax=Acer saccharum TaxID=4024 RepID=A0AA39RQG0_ACESA|nr:hypothetical protein LWI29_018334 [Acer saccharum]
MLMDCLEFPIYQLHKRPGSSGPSRDQSEDDDATTDNIDPADEKPMKMAEESIKRMAGLNPMFHAAILELSTMNLPSDSSADGAVPV